jgi:hypothetical protein
MKRLLVGLSLIVLLCVPMTVQALDIVLTWNLGTEPDLAGYKIYFAPQACTAQGPLAPLVVGGVAVQVGKVTTYRHVGIPSIDGTLCWEITAFDTSANESSRSNRVSKDVNMVPPLPPTGLNAVIQ